MGKERLGEGKKRSVLKPRPVSEHCRFIGGDKWVSVAVRWAYSGL
jgi:hypothetical protein